MNRKELCDLVTVAKKGAEHVIAKWEFDSYNEACATYYAWRCSWIGKLMCRIMPWWYRLDDAGIDREVRSIVASKSLPYDVWLAKDIVKECDGKLALFDNLPDWDNFSVTDYEIGNFIYFASVRVD